MEQEVLLKCRQALLVKQAELLPRVLQRHGIQIEKSGDPMDELVESGQRELAVSHLKRNSSLLKMILAALAKIDAGEFGVCPNCDQEIAGKRLSATPWATYCKTCAELMENEGADIECALPQNGFRADPKALEATDNSRAERVISYTPTPVSSSIDGRPAPDGVFDRIASQSRYHGGLYPSLAFLLSQNNGSSETRGRRHHKRK